MQLKGVNDLRNTQLVLCCLLIQPHLDAAFVNKDTHRRIVEPSLELSLIERHSKRLVGVTLALGRVMCHEIVVAESSALAARDDIMLP